MWWRTRRSKRSWIEPILATCHIPPPMVHVYHKHASNLPSGLDAPMAALRSFTFAALSVPAGSLSCGMKYPPWPPWPLLPPPLSNDDAPPPLPRASFSGLAAYTVRPCSASDATFTGDGCSQSHRRTNRQRGTTMTTGNT